MGLHKAGWAILRVEVHKSSKMSEDNSAFREEEEPQRCPQGRFSGRLCAISRGERRRTFWPRSRSGERRAGKPGLGLSLVGALRLGLRRAAGRCRRARLRPVAKREASSGRGGRWEGFCEGRWRLCSAKTPTESGPDELDGEAPRSGDSKWLLPRLSGSLFLRGPAEALFAFAPRLPFCSFLPSFRLPPPLAFLPSLERIRGFSTRVFLARLNVRANRLTNPPPGLFSKS